MTLGKGTGQGSNSAILMFVKMEWPWNRQQTGFYPKVFSHTVAESETQPPGKAFDRGLNDVGKL